MKNTIIIIPAYNEEDQKENTLKKLVNFKKKIKNLDIIINQHIYNTFARTAAGK